METPVEVKIRILKNREANLRAQAFEHEVNADLCDTCEPFCADDAERKTLAQKKADELELARQAHLMADRLCHLYTQLEEPVEA